MSDQMYRQQIIDHYKNPRNLGKIDDAEIKGNKYNYSCGDEIEVYAKVENGKIKDFKYEVRGCAISVAGASLLSEEIKDMPLGEVKNLDNKFIEQLLGAELTNSRIKCAMLALDALKENLEIKKLRS